MISIIVYLCFSGLKCWRGTESDGRIDLDQLECDFFGSDFCLKAIYPGFINRNCAMPKDVKAWKEEYGLTGPGCKTVRKDATICLCDTDLCNAD